MLKVKLLNSKAKVPSKANKTDAAFDLYAAESVTIPMGMSAKIKTGCAFEIPEGYGGFIWPRSKLSTRFSQMILAGVVDSGYRGEVMIAFINHGFEVMEVREGDRVAQMTIQPVYTGGIMAVESLSDSERGTSGINDSDLRLRD